MFRRITITLLALSLLLIGMVSVASAASPHFVSASDSVDASGNLVVTWKEAGLGNNLMIDYTARANATAVWGCINKGLNHPKASNKETVSGPVSASGTFNSGKNGQVTASLVMAPPSLPAGTLNCPPGQPTIALVSISYTGVTLADTTNSITVSLKDVSHTFYK